MFAEEAKLPGKGLPGPPELPKFENHRRSKGRNALRGGEG